MHYTQHQIFDTYQKRVESFLHNKTYTREEVHKLRTKARELYVLLDKDEPFRGVLKQLIKLSNEIRDIDVFQTTFLRSLPQKLLQALHPKYLKEKSDKVRETRIKKLVAHIKTLHLPGKVLFSSPKLPKEIIVQNYAFIDKRALHQYRIRIKSMLYSEKNALKRDEGKVQILTNIKDTLGTINDNLNGMHRLHHLSVPETLYKKVKQCKGKENSELFTLFQTYNAKLL